MKTILNGKVLISSLVIAVMLLCASLVYILKMRPAAVWNKAPGETSSWTIIPAPTSTIHLLPSTPTVFAFLQTASPTAAPGQIAVGVYVQPSTGGAGLLIHVEPGLKAALAFPKPAFDSEVFLVTDGPVQADGYTWWYLTASYDTSRRGWGAQEYLSVIPQP